MSERMPEQMPAKVSEYMWEICRSGDHTKHWFFKDDFNMLWVTLFLGRKIEQIRWIVITRVSISSSCRKACDTESASHIWPLCTPDPNRFRNYLRFRNYDSETTIQKLWRFRSYEVSETITIQKLSLFRN